MNSILATQNLLEKVDLNNSISRIDDKSFLKFDQSKMSEYDMMRKVDKSFVASSCANLKSIILDI